MTNKEKIKLVKEWVDQISTHGSARHRLLHEVLELATKGAMYAEEVKQDHRSLDQIPLRELR